MNSAPHLCSISLRCSRSFTDRYSAGSGSSSGEMKKRSNARIRAASRRATVTAFSTSITNRQDPTLQRLFTNLDPSCLFARDEQIGVFVLFSMYEWITEEKASRLRSLFVFVGTTRPRDVARF